MGSNHKIDLSDKEVAQNLWDKAVRLHSEGKVAGVVTCFADLVGLTPSGARHWVDKHNLRNDTSVSKKLVKDPDTGKMIEVETVTKVVTVEKEELVKKDPAEYIRIYKELDKSRSKVRHLDRVNKELVKKANVLDEVSDLLAPVIARDALPEPTYIPRKARTIDNPCSLVLSWNDWHWGEVVKSEQVEDLNNYNPNIAAARVEHLVNVTIDWIQFYGKIGTVEELVIVLNGDQFSGMHVIHPGKSTEYAFIVKQALDCAMVTAQAIWILSHYVPKIRVIAPSGDNHTRMANTKPPNSGTAQQTSYSTFYYNTLQDLLTSVEHVSFYKPASYTAQFTVQNRRIAAAHGHLMKGGGGNLGFPVYALHRLHTAKVMKSVVKTKREAEQLENFEKAVKSIAELVDITMIGHFHTHAWWQIMGGEVIIAPSLKGTDPYVNDNLEKYSPAEQMMTLIHPHKHELSYNKVSLQHIVDPNVKSRFSWDALTDPGESTLTLFNGWVSDSNVR